MPKSKQRESSGPEKKFGPYAGGISVAVWLNTIQTADGPRKTRSITISPRRYRDAKTGEWRDASSFRPGDIAIIAFALAKAQEYLFTTPIPDEEDADGQESSEQG
jgi:hypothetical protein